MGHLTALRGQSRARVACTAALALFACASATGRQAAPAGGRTYSVLLQGVRIGVETIAVTHDAGGWTIVSAGREAAPLDLVTTRFEVTYGPDWQPQRLSIEAVSRGELLTLGTSFSASTAVNDILQGGLKRTVTQQISPKTIVLPNNFFGAYAALAARLGTVPVGSTLPIYVAPQAEITATVNGVTPKRLSTPDGPVELRAFDLTFNNPAGPVATEVWVDADDRLARVAIPSGGIAVVRDDIASVMTREETIRNPGDEDVFIPAQGFSLAATITKPAAGGRTPAVVLVPGVGPEGRDQTTAGIPIFGQLAGAIAQSGSLAIRYDRRGVGQSGGRTEAATLTDYADDVVRVIEWARDRKDVDDDRIALVGYGGEGGAIALFVASHGHHVKALALAAAAGETGRELTLWQQNRALARLNLSAADRAAKVQLQQRLIDAVVSGKGWDALPAGLRQGSDTPWFRSWLLFDPADLMRDVDQPVLILHGSIDQEVPVSEADRLEALALARKNGRQRTRKVLIPGVNHLLAAATTGEPDEYRTLAAKTVAPGVTAALTTWLKDVLAANRK